MPSQSIDLFGEVPNPGKRCTVCKVWKPISAYIFLKLKPGEPRSYYRGDCKVCCNKKQVAWYQKNRNGLARNRVLRRNYGITLQQYEDILKSQGGVCAICGKIDHTKRRLAVDHDHETKKVRGLLCHLCNQAIGQLKHSTELLQNAIDYLKKHA